MQGLVILTSKLFEASGFRHAFFTRRGGVSVGPYASLNFSASTGDSRTNVDENRSRAARALGVSDDRIYFLSQVHGTRSVVADGGTSWERFVEGEGDTVISAVASLACAVRSADCVPILLADRVSGVAAAVHAGWRGVVQRTLSHAVAGLRELQGHRGDLIAAVGPHISQSAFEVSEEVAAELERISLVGGVVDRRKSRPHVDLRRILHAELLSLGLLESAVDHVWGCTASDSESFFSFRREGPASGRHLSAIVPRTNRE